MLLLIDNYDSFTYNLKDYFEQLGQEVLVVMNDQLDESTLKIKFERVVISPGPNTPIQSGNLMSMMPHLVKNTPVLGICLGHQALGQYFGAKLLEAELPMHGKVSAITHNQTGIYAGIPNPMNVCRYHSLILKDLDQTDLKLTAATSEGECMGFAHKTLPIQGIQYHPEAILTENGLKLLDNWLNMTS
ncbi:MAG TPA: aminodeoxychorismate/anthranilate synthase component II [Bacteroidia bacterium]